MCGCLLGAGGLLATTRVVRVRVAAQHISSAAGWASSQVATLDQLGCSMLAFLHT